MTAAEHRRHHRLPVTALFCAALAWLVPVHATRAQIGAVVFDYDLEAITGGGGAAGAIFIPNEFWVSRWGSDELFRIQANGALIEGPFTVPGLSGTRALTWDGSLVWAANATSTIYGIDPSSKTIVDTITIAGLTPRYVSYDETGHGGAGGFWVGDWDTDAWLIGYDGIAYDFVDDPVLVDMGGRYGAAIDHVSPAGPYLWFFHQTPPPGETGSAWISQYQDPAPTGYTFDVASALGYSTTNLAGGLFLMQDPSVPGRMILAGVLQGNLPGANRLFGFELSTVANDECVDAIPIDCNSTITADNTGATTAPDDPDFSCRFGDPGPGSASVWYSFVAADTTVLIETCGTAPGTDADDSLLQLYEGSCGAMVALHCSEDDCSNGETDFLSKICKGNLTPGQTYYVELASYDAFDRGPYQLSITCPCPDLVCPDTSVASNPATDVGVLWLAVADSSSVPSYVLAMPFDTGGSPFSTLALWPIMWNFDLGDSCVEVPSTFEVAFAEDLNGLPGRVHCSYDISSDMIGGSFISLERLLVGLEQAAGACELSDGWILVQGYGGDPDCEFRVFGSGAPASGTFATYDDGSGWQAAASLADFFFCLAASASTGACCIPGDVCGQFTETECDSLGGVFQGEGTLCASVSCGYDLLLEPFVYASDVALQTIWDGGDVEPDGYGLQIATGNPNNSYLLTDQPFTTFGRLRFEFDQDEKPNENQALVVTFDLYLDPAGAATSWDGASHWIEFGGHDGDDYGIGSKTGEVQFGLIDPAVTGPLGDTYSNAYYQASIFANSSQFTYTLDAEPNAPMRTAGWHTLQCRVTQNNELGSPAWHYEFFIDGMLAEARDRYGQDGFDWIRLGSGRPTNGYLSALDNVRVSIVALTVPPPCPADVTGDLVVNTSDFLAILAHWGVCDSCPQNCPDTNGDCTVDTIDFLAILSNWGPCPAP
jgi:hypothetical protein